MEKDAQRLVLRRRDPPRGRHGDCRTQAPSRVTRGIEASLGAEASETAALVRTASSETFSQPMCRPRHSIARATGRRCPAACRSNNKTSGLLGPRIDVLGPGAGS